MSKQAKGDEFQSDNPYSVPNIALQSHGLMATGNTGYVRQVKPLCICMIILGVLEILMGVMWVAMAFLLPVMIMNQQGGAGPQVPPDRLEMAQAIMGFSYGGIGVVAMLAGGLRIGGGWRGLYFRSYRLGLISHFVGLLTFVTCYCVPTAIGLCAWGCIVYFRLEVKNAFKMGEQGYTATEIETGNIQPPSQESGSS